jgi:integrase/recombinase XerC
MKATPVSRAAEDVEEDSFNVWLAGHPGEPLRIVNDALRFCLLGTYPGLVDARCPFRQHIRLAVAVEQVRAILRACEGKSFHHQRDYAMVMLFIDTGIRRAEMADLRLEDIDWANQSVIVRKGKGRKGRTVYFGKRTLRALDQYVRLRGGRRDHRDSHLPDLWLGNRGALSDDGIYHVLKTRGDQAGVPYMHPHLWRHYFIHASLKAGANPGDLMRQTGHARIEQLLHYGEAAADERARESHRRLGPGDNL